MPLARLLPALLLICTLLAGCGQGGEEPAQSAADAPKMQAIDEAGFDALVAETTERGQVLVVDFWGTWCGPCVQLFDPLHRAVEAIDGVRLVSIAWAFEEDLKAEIDFLTEHKALKDAYYIAFDTDLDDFHAHVGQRMADPTDVGTYPLILVFDRQGRVVSEFGSGSGTLDAATIASTAQAAAKPQGPSNGIPKASAQ